MKLKLAVFLILVFSTGFFSLSSQAATENFDLEKLKLFLRTTEVVTQVDDSSPYLKGQSKEQPWSSSYLPASNGYAADAYADYSALEGFVSGGFKAWSRDRMVTLAARFGEMTDEQVAILAPSEKYDLLTGMFGTDQSLTAKLWLMSEETRKENGIKSWTGMCHGWAPASISEPRPVHTFSVKSVPYHYRGKDLQFNIRFYPDDVKVLLSLLWANSWTFTSMEPKDWSGNVLPMAFSKCEKRRPERDSDGRIVSESCADTDPAFWHLLVINHVGKDRRALVIDHNYNAPVNNHPLTSYEITFFNPRSGEDGSYDRSTVSRAEFLDDIMSEHRLEKTRTIVGVDMKINVVKWTELTHAELDSPANDRIKDDHFLYDLELDENGKIIGGEWRNNKKNRTTPFLGLRPRAPHPDFVWYVPEGIQASTLIEATAIGDWSINQPLPSSYRDAALGGAMMTINWKGKKDTDPSDNDLRPQVVSKIVHELLRASRE